MKPATDKNHVSTNFEKIIAYSEGGLATGERQQLEQHLQLCSACAALLRETQQLDAALEARFSQPAQPMLSTAFEQRVYERLEREDALPQVTAQTRAQLLAEFNEYSARLRRQFFRPARLLDLASYAIGAGVLVWLLMQFSSAMETRLESSWSSLGSFRGLLVPSLAAALIAVCLFAFAFKGSLKTLTEET